MLTCRELTLILLTALTTTGLVTFGQSAKIAPMNSIAIEWNSVRPKSTATGSGRKFILGPTTTLDRLDCHASTLNPGAMNHEILTRPDDEVAIIKEGTVQAYITDKWVSVGPGSVIFNARNEPQAMRNTSDAPATYHVVSFRVAIPSQSPATRAN
jgi:mannose-6-phosphate isomerase-like protein (cupin superfamily)